jgi:predicted RNA-binding Zn ribbon-like protein
MPRASTTIEVIAADGSAASTRASAPAPLEVVQNFVNTLDREGGRDMLPNADALAAWLQCHGLIEVDAAIGKDDFTRAIAVREAIRALLVANAGGPVDPDAVRLLNQVAQRARPGIAFDQTGAASLQPDAGGVDGALGRILAIVYESMADRTWSRLKACRRDVCRWAFYDTSKNRSGTWCSMAVCGNRVKTRAYRARHAKLTPANCGLDQADSATK